MKKAIIITCLIFSLIGIFIVASPLILRLTGLDKPAKEYLINKIFGDNKHHIDLQKINIGLGNFEINGISFVSDDHRLEILINKIVLDFDIIDFFKLPFDPKSALREIYIDQPQLIIHQKNGQNSKDSVFIQSPDLVSVISELNDYNNLRINDGEIIYENASGLFINYAQNLNGWLQTKNKHEISVNVIGSAFSPDAENFKLDVKYDNNTNKFLSRIDILNYNFDESSVYQIIKDLKLKGTTSGYLNIRGDLRHLDSMIVSGDIQIMDLAAVYKGESVENADLNIEIQKNSLHIQNGKLDYQNHLFTVNGFCGNIFNPELSGTITSKELPVASFKKYIPDKLFNGSKIDLNLNYVINPDTYSVQGDIKSNDFSLYKSHFSNFKTTFIVNDDAVQVPVIYAMNNELELDGKGIYSIGKSKLDISLNGNYKFGKHVLFDQLSESNQRFSINYSFNTSTGQSNGDWNYALSKKDSMLWAAGYILGDFKALKIELTKSNFDSLKAKVKVSDYFGSKPHVDYAVLENIPFHILSSDKILYNFFSGIKTRAELSGNINDFSSQVLIRESATNDTIATLTAKIENLISGNKTAEGRLSVKNLDGQYKVDFDQTNLKSWFNFDNQIFGNFMVDLANKKEQLNGKIKIQNFKVLQALLDNIPVNDYHYEGVINGQIKINGTLKDPKVKTQLFGEKFVLNDVGYYQPQLYLSIDRTSVKADTIKIFQNNSEIIHGYLFWGLLNDQIFGEIDGKKIDISTIFSSLSLNNNIISGTGNFNFRLKGNIFKPNLEADLSFFNGTLDGIEYDKLDMSIIDEIVENSNVLNYKNHKIELQNLYIARKGHFHLNGVGSLPLDSKNEMDLILNFDGDLLSLIPHWEPFFTNGASLADVTLKFKGTSDNVRLAACDINIERGELWLKDVAPHITNINGKIEMLEGSDRVNMNIIAYVDDDYLKINTVRDIKTAEGRKLENWYFKGLGLDFGILALNTSGKGVNLNIPGLMEKQDFGKIHLSGKAEGESFYFAGPVKHPVGYGVVTLNDALITYPFITSNNPSQKPSPTVRFLSNMDWDATLKSGEDVLYVRDIPAYIDNVHAEISVDERSEGLQFDGIIDKGTFKPVGTLVSTRGHLEYLDQNFKVDRFTLEFSAYKDLPDVSGRAWTTIRDSVGAVPKTIYLQLYAIDPETGLVNQSGNWGDFKFKLVSADPVDQETQETVLSYMGYSVDNIKNKATNVGGAITDKYLIRPLLRPVERVLEKSLGMDLVRFNSSIAKNLFYSSLGKQSNKESANPLINPYSNDASYLYLMSSSEVTVGKYLNENLYLTYTGQLVSVYQSAQTDYDFNHSLELEYRFYKNILLEFEWDRELKGYYNFQNQRQYLEDFKIRLRHSFTF